MQTTRRHTMKVLGAAALVGATGLSAEALAQSSRADFRFGKVFTSTNDVTANELLVYDQTASGELTLLTRLPTQGRGTGTSSGVQGAVTLSRDGRYLFVVNTLSDTVSTFFVQPRGLTLASTVPAGDSRPLGVTEFNGVVYVLNEGFFGSLTGFRNVGGVLQPLPLSYRQLSPSGATAPGQVGFSPDGELLFVTLRLTDTLLSYRVGSNGVTDALVTARSAGRTPFGFAFDRRGNAVVAVAFRNAANAGALSAVGFGGADGITPQTVSRPTGSTQTGTCCVAVSPDGRTAYAVNTVSDTVSRFAISTQGRLSLVEAVAGATGHAPIAAAISATERKLYVLNSLGLTISAFDIGGDGSLAGAVVGSGLPVGVSGLAAN